MILARHGRLSSHHKILREMSSALVRCQSCCPMSVYWSRRRIIIFDCGKKTEV